MTFATRRKIVLASRIINLLMIVLFLALALLG
jgi:hypothetical protein